MACIQGIHTGLAYFGGPHWLMDDPDAQRYAQAVANVARHYDLEVAQKTVDWFNLAGLIAFYEGTRLLAQRGQRQQRQPQQRGQVVPFFQFGNQNPPAATGPSPAAPAGEPFGPPYNPDAPPEGQLH